MISTENLHFSLRNQKKNSIYFYLLRKEDLVDVSNAQRELI